MLASRMNEKAYSIENGTLLHHTRHAYLQCSNVLETVQYSDQLCIITIISVMGIAVTRNTQLIQINGATQLST